MSLKDRRDEMEARYAHDQEKKFKIESRRNRIVGQWAAAKLGKSGPDADAYVQDVLKASFSRPGDEDIVEKIEADFQSAGVDVSADGIRRELETAFIEAERQVNEA